MIKKLIFAALMTAFTAVAAQISFSINMVPFTASIVAVMLCGLICEPKYALFSQLVYLLLGFAGLPVFASFSGGVSKLIGPTGGFLIVFPLMAFLISLLVHKFSANIFFACLLSLPLCYLFGAAWFMIFVRGKGFFDVMMITVIPFIPIDIAKALLSCAVYKAVLKVQNKNYEA